VLIVIGRLVVFVRRQSHEAGVAVVIDLGRQLSCIAALDLRRPGVFVGLDKRVFALLAATGGLFGNITRDVVFELGSIEVGRAARHRVTIYLGQVAAIVGGGVMSATIRVIAEIVLQNIIGTTAIAALHQ
jgi:hypothetical protein